MIKSETAAEALLSWCDERGVVRGVEEFTAFLRRRNLTYVLPSLLTSLNFRTAAEKQGRLLSIKSGQPLAEKDQTELKDVFTSDATAAAEVKLDPDMIAGVSVEQGGRLIEASVGQQLQALKSHLHT